MRIDFGAQPFGPIEIADDDSIATIECTQALPRDPDSDLMTVELKVAYRRPVDGEIIDPAAAVEAIKTSGIYIPPVAELGYTDEWLNGSRASDG